MDFDWGVNFFAIFFFTRGIGARPPHIQKYLLHVLLNQPEHSVQSYFYHKTRHKHLLFL